LARSGEITETVEPTTTIGTPASPGWNPVVVGPADEFASVRLAAGPGGLVMSVSQDSSEPPTLWYSQDGGEWDQVAELPIERVAIGAPLVGVGEVGMVALKVGDPESEAFGEPSELAVWISTDGRTWTEADSAGFAAAGYLHDVRSTEFGWVVAGEYAVDAHTVVPAIYHSVDGSSWQRVMRGDGSGVARSVLVADGVLLVVGSQGGFPMVWRSTDGIDWTESPLPAETHGGEATAGAWIGDRWLVVGTGSETEPMAIWESTNGSRWEKLGQLVDPEDSTLVWENRFGVGILLDGRLAVGATRLGFAHENFCYETERCFVHHPSLLITSDGVSWEEIPAPLADHPFSPQPPTVIATTTGRLVSATIYDGQLTVWSRTERDAVPLQRDPPVPALSIERAEWGQALQPDTRYAWRLGTHCGIGQLGEFNERIWQLDDVNQSAPAGFDGYRGVYGVIVLADRGDGPVITFTAGDQVLGPYLPMPLTAVQFCM
jgi:hypothetical protein